MWYIRIDSTVGLQSPCNAVHISLSGGYLIPHKLPAFSFFGPERDINNMPSRLSGASSSGNRKIPYMGFHGMLGSNQKGADPIATHAWFTPITIFFNCQSIKVSGALTNRTITVRRNRCHPPGSRGRPSCYRRPRQYRGGPSGCRRQIQKGRVRL